ncbi:MAG: DUF362 domain-containing protein [Deltaproteobacteria bacterium]|nr:DUF362 domain-containing protein [Deltaproteobacteria bacterium]
MKKIENLFAAAGFGAIAPKDALTAVKLHFGERGNDTFLNPVFVRTVVDLLKASGAKPFLTDSNTLYNGSRHNAVDHLQTAVEHGFSYATTGAPVIIADGLSGTSFSSVFIGKNHFQEVKIAGAIADAHSMLVLSHFKGHEMAGFGGAIKNLAMGCSPSQGKCEQHSSGFSVTGERCIACGMCMANCPQEAISWEKNGARRTACIDKILCVGCGECLTVCEPKAVTIDWGSELKPLMERIAEYACGAMAGKEGRVGFISFLMNITPDCDCVAWSDSPLVPDIGILASRDPVALDTACRDLVNQQTGLPNSHLKCNHEPGEDKFKGAWKHTGGEWLLSYAQSIGLGSASYELIPV